MEICLRSKPQRLNHAWGMFKLACEHEPFVELYKRALRVTENLLDYCILGVAANGWIMTPVQ